MGQPAVAELAVFARSEGVCLVEAAEGGEGLAGHRKIVRGKEPTSFRIAGPVSVVPVEVVDKRLICRRVQVVGSRVDGLTANGRLRRKRAASRKPREPIGCRLAIVVDER